MLYTYLKNYIIMFHKIWRYFMFKSQFLLLYFDVSSRMSNWWKSCGQGRPILGEQSNFEQISLFCRENVHLNFTHRITPLHVTNGFFDICMWATQCCMKQVNFWEKLHPNKISNYELKINKKAFQSKANQPLADRCMI